MKKIAVLILVVLIFVGCTSVELPTPVPAISHYQIVNVNVVDVINSKIINAQDVEVQNGIIVSMLPHLSSGSNNAPILTIDGTEQFLIPGLWDFHGVLNQLSPYIDYPLYIAHGITSLRSILNCPNEDEVSIYPCMAEKFTWNTQVANGSLVGPRIAGSGTFPINGKSMLHPDSPSFHGGGSVADAIKIVEHYAEFQPELRPYSLKVYNNLSKDSYLALAASARDAGFDISGHKPRAVRIDEAITAGQRSFAHARLFLYECSVLKQELSEGQYWQLPLPEFYRLLLNNVDEESCQSIMQNMAANNVYLSPTLLTRRNDYLAVADKQELVQGLDYAHYMFAREWDEDIGKLKADIKTEEDVQTMLLFYQAASKSIGEAHRNGVKIMAGTDSYDIYVVPGFSIHEEMLLLHEAGLGNFDVLRAATLNTASYFGVQEKYGSIDKGKVADMVLLQENPISDIKNTTTIQTVFHGRQIYSQAAIGGLKQHAKTLANSHRVTQKLIWLFLQNPTGF
ncbi:amidohydrolase family protein [Alteromonadaceae bacterium BrNp21-10]|nr:amidohydrolase family protein [Alteromonadaceae bacterium BrNp21-10]